MKKSLLFLFVFAMATTLFAQQGGTLTSDPEVIDPTGNATLYYDGTGTNFASWEPMCYIHTWLDAKDGEIFSKSSYSTTWTECNGDDDYNALDDKVKMTYDGTPGKYSIAINIKTFFDVADEDLEKIKQLGVIVKTQYSANGNNDKTKNLYVSVGELVTASDRFHLAYGVEEEEGWQFPEFTADETDEAGNKFTLEMTIPDNVAELSCYVGYNGGGTGNPTWTAGKSNTIPMSSIDNVTAGTKGVFTIYKDSDSPNWWLNFTPEATVALEQISAASVYANNGTIYADGNLEIFTLTGINVTSTNGNLKGAYIVKVDGKPSKIMVK